METNGTSNASAPQTAGNGPMRTPQVQPGKPATAAPEAASPMAPRAPEPVIWKRAENDEIDVGPYIRDYKRKVPVGKDESGQPIHTEIHIEDAYRVAGMETVVRRKMTDADKLRKKLEADMATHKRIVESINDPRFAERLLEQRWGGEKGGRQKLVEFALGIVEAENAYLAMKPEDRARVDAQRKAQLQIDQERERLAAERAEVEAFKAQRQKEAAERFRKRIAQQWPVMLHEQGVPKDREWTQDAMEAMHKMLRRAQQEKTPLTEAQAARAVGKHFASKAARLQPTVADIADQPGRQVPERQPEPSRGPTAKKPIIGYGKWK